MFNKYTMTILSLLYMIYIFLVYGNFDAKIDKVVVYYITAIIGITSLYMAFKVTFDLNLSINIRIFSGFIHCLNFYLSYHVFRELKNNVELKDIRSEYKIPLTLTLWLGMVLLGNRISIKTLRNSLSLKKI